MHNDWRRDRRTGPQTNGTMDEVNFSKRATRDEKKL